MANVSRDYADQIAKDRGEAMDELERRNMSDKQEPHLRFGGAHAKEAIIAALSSAGIDCEGWRDIESAPANQLVLLFCPERGVANLERIELGYASHGSPRTAMSYHAWATHWMPLPLPPLASGGG